jgi:hypothetical protein
MKKSYLLILLATSCTEYEMKQHDDDNLEAIDTAQVEPIPAEEVEPDEDSADTFDEAVDEPSGPVADCVVAPNPVHPPFESATWDGSGSYDANGGTITAYAWQLVEVPEGSAVSLSNPNNQTVAGFTPDLAGNYVAELTITNDAGLTDTCEATLESIPAQNLWVEMYWEKPQDDMDLHLIAPGQNWQTAKTTDNDCYYGNCTDLFGLGSSLLDWGQFLYEPDNPILDLDDIPGTGPENINIEEPESTGSYTVVVHDFTGSTPDVQGPNNVTVNIYLDGTLYWSDTRPISGDGSYTPFAEINWATMEVTGL